MNPIELPPNTRIVLICYEDDTWSVRVPHGVAAVATSEPAACEAIAHLVDAGACTDAEALNLCVQLARAVDAARSPVPTEEC